MHFGVPLAALVEKRLADGQAPGVGLGAQPVPGCSSLGDDHLEAAVGLDVHLLLVQRGPGPGPPPPNPAPEKRLKLIHFASPRVPQIR